MTNPQLITTPFAENGTKNIIPEGGASEPQLATMQAGFPETTQRPISEGGIPPERADFNGILNLYGQHIVHINKGLPYEFDQDFANSIGGYPLNARIMLSSGDVVQNTQENNTNNPNINMGGWKSNAVSKDATVPTYKTAADGVNPVTGVADGAYFNVRSSSDEAYIDEYQNVGGSAVATGKSYPSGSYVEAIAEYTALPFKVGKSYALYERVQLDSGDVVKSTVANNTANPNTDMTGWRLDNNTVNTISVMQSVQAVNNMRLYVESYNSPNLVLAKPYFGGGGGQFKFDKGSADTPDNVYSFTGVGGIWKRLNWRNPTVYDAGIFDESLDNTVRFKALLLSANTYISGIKDIDLLGFRLKVTDFIMYSNMTIQNGHLDFTASTVIDSSNFASAGFIVGENAPYRNQDPAVHTRYTELPAIKNFGFKNVEFTSPAATANIRRNIMAFYKWQGFTLLRCKFNLNGARAYKAVGGFDNSNYEGLGLWDQPVPYNGFSAKAKVKFNEFISTGFSVNASGKNILSDTGQFAAADRVEFSYNKCENVMIGAYFDAFTKNSTAHHNTYTITDDQVANFINSSVQSVVGVYIGQCALNISAYKNKVTNSTNHNIIMEAASDCQVYGNTIVHTPALQALATTQANAIVVQANIISDATSGTTMTKGCEDIHIYDNIANGVRQGVLISSVHANSARKINLHDNTMYTKTGGAASIAVSNIVDSTISNNKGNSLLSLGAATNCDIIDNSFKSTSNYALFLTSGAKSGLKIKGNDFVVDSGSAIYNGSASGNLIEIEGGTIQSKDGSALLQNGSGVGAVRAYNFKNGVTELRQSISPTINLAAGARTVISQPIAGVKSGWLSEAKLNSLGSLWTGSSIDLTLKSGCRSDAVDILVRNDGASPVNLTFTFLIELSPFLSNTYTN